MVYNFLNNSSNVKFCVGKKIRPNNMSYQIFELIYNKVLFTPWTQSNTVFSWCIYQLKAEESRIL